MATLNTLLVNGNSVNGTRNWDTNQNYLNIDEAIGSADGLAIIDNTNGNSLQVSSYLLSSTDSIFVSMTTLSWQIRRRVNGPQTNTRILGVRIVAESDGTVLAALNPGGFFQIVGTITNTAFDNGSVTAFTYVNTTATKAQWDDARIEFQNDVSKNMSGDSNGLEIDTVEITGTMVAANSPIASSITTDSSISATLTDKPGKIIGDAITGGVLVQPTQSQLGTIGYSDQRVWANIHLDFTGRIKTVEVWLQSVGSPDFDIRCEIRPTITDAGVKEPDVIANAHEAASADLDATTIPASLTKYTFTFAGNYYNEDIAITFRFLNEVTNNATNRIRIGWENPRPSPYMYLCHATADFAWINATNLVYRTSINDGVRILTEANLQDKPIGPIDSNITGISTIVKARLQASNLQAKIYSGNRRGWQEYYSSSGNYPLRKVDGYDILISNLYWEGGGFNKYFAYIEKAGNPDYYTRVTLYNSDASLNLGSVVKDLGLFGVEELTQGIRAFHPFNFDIDDLPKGFYAIKFEVVKETIQTSTSSDYLSLKYIVNNPGDYPHRVNLTNQTYNRRWDTQVENTVSNVFLMSKVGQGFKSYPYTANLTKKGQISGHIAPFKTALGKKFDWTKTTTNFTAILADSGGGSYLETAGLYFYDAKFKIKHIDFGFWIFGSNVFNMKFQPELWRVDLSGDHPLERLEVGEIFEWKDLDNQGQLYKIRFNFSGKVYNGRVGFLVRMIGGLDDNSENIPLPVAIWGNSLNAKPIGYRSVFTGSMSGLPSAPIYRLNEGLNGQEITAYLGDIGNRWSEVFTDSTVVGALTDSIDPNQMSGNINTQSSVVGALLAKANIVITLSTFSTISAALIGKVEIASAVTTNSTITATLIATGNLSANIENSTELIENGVFDGVTGWTISEPSGTTGWRLNPGDAHHTTSGAAFGRLLTNSGGVVSGKRYRLVLDIESSDALFQIKIGGNFQSLLPSGVNLGYEQVFTSVATGSVQFQGATNLTHRISNITVKEVAVVGELEAKGTMISSVSTDSTITANLTGLGELASDITTDSTITSDLTPAQAIGTLASDITTDSTITSTLSALGALLSDITTDSTITGILLSDIFAASDITTSSTIGATLSAGGQLASSINTDSTISADIYGKALMASAITTDSTITGLLINNALVSSINTDSLVSVIITANGSLASVVNTNSVTTSNLDNEALVSNVATSSTISASLTANGELQALINTLSTPAGIATARGNVVITLSTFSTISATLSGEGSLITTITTDSTVSGSITANGSLQSTVTTASTILATLGAMIEIQSDILTSSTISATLIGKSDAFLIGNINTQSSVVGTLSIPKQLLSATKSYSYTVGVITPVPAPKPACTFEVNYISEIYLIDYYENIHEIKYKCH